MDLIVLNGAADDTVIYGRAVVKNEQIQVEDQNGKAPGEDGYIPTYRTTSTVEVQYGAGKTTGPIKAGYAVRTGDYVAVTLAKDGKSFTSLTMLDKMQNVSNSAWSGKDAVTIGGRSYTVPSDVPCYNADTNTWVTLDQAHAYASTADIYVSGGVVRAIEVSH